MNGPFFLDQPNNPLKPVDFVGRAGIEAFERFCRYIQIFPERLDTGSYEARLAPSVVVRGELQLFNLDIPRFCVRVYLDREGESFINLRRTAEVIRRLQAEMWMSTRGEIRGFTEGDESDPYRIVEPVESIADLFEGRNSKDNVVADCLLRPPDRLNPRTIDFVTADLGWQYGEGKSIRAVPYVRPLYGFGGAACAQACAFMVSALLCDHPPGGPGGTGAVPGMHGLTEITAFMTPPAYDFVKMHGLRFSVIADYFVRTKRTVFEYAFFPHPSPAGVLATGDGDDCHAVISSHARSGFASIFFVREPEEDGTLPDRPNHAVVVVGTSRPGSAPGARASFVINCPSRRPFESWDESTLRDKAYVDENMPATALCVLPAEIQMPLCDGLVQTAAGSEPRLGVVTLADAAGRPHPGGRAPAASDFLLFHILLEAGNGADRVGIPKGFFAAFGGDESLTERWRTSPLLRSLAGRWAWLQLGRDGSHALTRINLWDAQATPPAAAQGGTLFDAQGAERALAFRLGSVIRTGTAWRFDGGPGAKSVKPLSPPYCYLPPERSPHPAPPDRPAGRPAAGFLQRAYTKTGGWARRKSHAMWEGAKKLRARHQTCHDVSPSLITSFSATRLELAIDHWPRGVRYADLYAFMHCDDVLFHDFESYGPGTRPSVVEMLARIDKMGERERGGWVEKISHRVRSAAGRKNLVFGSMTTFMPQLYSSNTKRAMEAIHALAALAAVRDHMAANGHDIRTIEVVGGSLIGGLVPAMKAAAGGRRRLFALRRTRPRAYLLLLKRLAHLVRRLRARGAIGFGFALELEPGPLYVVNGAEALAEIARLIETTDEFAGLRDVVGFNIDLAHCILAGMEPADVFGSPAVARRICHFHVSDHGSGHFGDTALGDCGFGAHCVGDEDRLRLLRPWVLAVVAYARQRAAGGDAGLPFSNLISLEFEAARSPHLVERSCDTLKTLLAEARAELDRAKRRPRAGMGMTVDLPEHLRTRATNRR